MILATERIPGLFQLGLPGAAILFQDNATAPPDLMA